MTHDRIIKIGLSIVLSMGFLAACGGRDTQTNNPSDETADLPSESVTAPGDEATAPDPDEPAPNDNLGTAINPPQSANLTAEQADAEINLRSQPTTESTSEGYGLVGDSVELLRATEGEGELTWYFVKFDQSGAEGWIRGDFIDTSGSSAGQSPDSNISIDAFTTDELFAMGGGGCGMTLWSVDNVGDFIFFNGLPGDSMWMKLDGTMTAFRRTAASGPEFYGQMANQTFVNSDADIEVNVTAKVGSEEGYESVNIEQGKLILEDASGGTLEMTVEGDAGC
ncbi:MAG: SH3 domain-containing protein [Leptolyngbya sp. SIOISBB]|nr:SH3 domain-containing protein [Leptolyngbya sp. SIOISBB]